MPTIVLTPQNSVVSITLCQGTNLNRIWEYAAIGIYGSDGELLIEGSIAYCPATKKMRFGFNPGGGITKVGDSEKLTS